MGKVVTNRKLSDFRWRPKSKDLKTSAERMAAMLLICKNRTEDGHIKLKFRRIPMTDKQLEGMNASAV